MEKLESKLNTLRPFLTLLLPIENVIFLESDKGS